MNILKVNIECINNDNKHKLFVYGIRNKITNKYYIGSTINKQGIYVRFRRHIYHLKSNTHHSIKLQRSFNKYHQNFNHWEIILFKEITNQNYRLIEQQYIDKYNSYHDGYNSTPFVGIVNFGKMSDKHRKAISNSKQNMTDLDIIDIFQKYNIGLTYVQISKYYGLSRPTISAIINKHQYYSEIKEKYELKKKWYSYIFYDLTNNKLHRVNNFSKFCKEKNLNGNMMMPLMLKKFKMTFINNWTVFKRNEFSQSELKNRIKINNKVHVLFKDGIEYRFKCVKDFCKNNKLDETTIYHVLNGNKLSTKGFSKM